MERLRRLQPPEARMFSFVLITGFIAPAGLPGAPEGARGAHGPAR